MRQIIVFCVSCALLMPVVATAEDKIEAPTIQKRIEPEYAADLKIFVIEPAQVEIVIDQEGVPFSLQSITSLPDNVVQALSKWRYKPAKKNGTAVGYRLGVVVPIHRPLQNIARQRLQKRAKDITDALAAAKKLDAAEAARMEQQLNPKNDGVGAHLTLLAFSKTGSDEAARQMRLRQILWLAINQPEHDVLAAPYATMTEPSPAEADLFQEIRSVWLEQLARGADDPAILDHATNFLRFTDPGVVEHTIQQVVDKTDRAAVFLGDLYGLAALGATAVDPNTGDVAAVSEKAAGSPFAIQARDALDKTGDLRVVFSALTTVSGAGRPLAKAGQVPAGYAELCGKLLTRARAAYADVQDQCLAKPAPENGSKVQAANLIKPVRPSYPQDAKSRHITGTLNFQATITKDGRIQDLELLRGPLALYGAAREAVLKWEYQPTRLDDVPVAVSTTIDVNFNLN